jgi:hypothetical protein
MFGGTHMTPRPKDTLPTPYLSSGRSAPTQRDNTEGRGVRQGTPAIQRTGLNNNAQASTKGRPTTTHEHDAEHRPETHMRRREHNSNTDRLTASPSHAPRHKSDADSVLGEQSYSEQQTNQAYIHLVPSDAPRHTSDADSVIRKQTYS